jgi:hypothetical protein
MPATPTAFTAPDRLTADGLVRTCCDCGFEGLLVPENFYRRAGQERFERRCQTCRHRRAREVARLRRAGQPVRAARRRFERKFGVEIEFIGAHHAAVVAKMNARGVACTYEGYTHRVGSGWKVVTDASVPGGYELVSPPLKGANGFEQLRKACEALAEAGARVDRRCGLHVHHDVSDLSGSDFGRLFRGWAANQPATDGLVAPSRRNSQWARPLNADDLRRVDDLPAAASGVAALGGFFGSYSDQYRRYRSLNVQCFPRYGTVEVRQHQGSTSYPKIAAWVAFGQAFVAAAKAGDVEVATDAPALVEVLSRTGRLPAAHATVLRQRAEHFSGRRQPVAA